MKVFRVKVTIVPYFVPYFLSGKVKVFLFGPESGPPRFLARNLDHLDFWPKIWPTGISFRPGMWPTQISTPGTTDRDNRQPVGSLAIVHHLNVLVCGSRRYREPCRQVVKASPCPFGPLGSSSSQHRRTPEIVVWKGHASFRITSAPPVHRIAATG